MLLGLQNSFLRVFLVLIWINNTNQNFRTSDEETDARVMMNIIDEEYSKVKRLEASTTYQYNINVNDFNFDRMLTAMSNTNSFLYDIRRRLADFQWTNFQNQTLKRMFEKFNNIGIYGLPPDQFILYMNMVINLQKNYDETTICHYESRDDCTLDLPEINRILSISRDNNELLHYWVAWHDQITSKIREEMKEFDRLFIHENETASTLNYSNAAEMWLKDFEINNFDKRVIRVWLKIKPLYKQLHAYVRRKLRMFYGNVINQKGTIPAHLLGDLWGGNWNVYRSTIPYPLNIPPNITDMLIKQNCNINCMAFKTESFFRSMNLTRLMPKFWKQSILRKSNNRLMSCQPSAWDLFINENFRIKLCLNQTGIDLINLHHELAHVHSFMEHRHQPIIFRTELNPGFHEAIAEAVVMSAVTQTHLNNIGLLKKHAKDEQETMINALFHLALKTITQLPYALILDLHRWRIFRGLDPNPDQYNCEWWKLREKFQGIGTPTRRKESDYDFLSKFHVVASKPYVSRFVGIVQQFQVYKALCIKAGQYNPTDVSLSRKKLQHCDFSNNTEAAIALQEILSVGSSKPWQEVMQNLTGTDVLSPDSLLEYFEPLQKYLERENLKNGEFIGWKRTSRLCRTSIIESTN